MKGLKASSTKFNFGSIGRDTQVERNIIVKNESDQLVMLVPWRSCGCTTPILTKDKLQPGEITNLKIVFDSSGKSGYQEKNVGVNYYIDGKPQVLTITFTADIKKQ